MIFTYLRCIYVHSESSPQCRPLSRIDPVFVESQIHCDDVCGHDDRIIAVDTAARWHQEKKQIRQVDDEKDPFPVY